MAAIRDFTMVLGLMENGKFASELSEFVRGVIAELHDVSEVKNGAQVKGSAALKLSFTVKDGTIEIAADMTKVVPKMPRRSSHFWIGEGGELSTEHPSQHDMFPRPVSDDRERRA